MIQDELSWQQQQLQKQFPQLQQRQGKGDGQEQQEHVIKVYDRDSKKSRILLTQVLFPQQEASEVMDPPQPADLIGKY
jgi:hypothetical protein